MVRGFLILSAAAAAFAPAAPSAAQNALGGGDALSRDMRHQDTRRTSNYGVLDANTQLGSLGDNGQAAKVDYFSRNLIVTGDVGGGREFRGSVGYREQSEFTGQTGADDLRFWTAYSVYSSPYMAQANYNPLQASQQFGAIMYTRTYSNAAARDILTDQQPLDARIAFDRFTADGAKKMKRQADIIDPANQRDVSERLNWRVQQAISQASGRTQRNDVALDDALSGLGLTTYDRQRLKQDIISGRTQRDLIVGDPLSSSMVLPGQDAMMDARLKPILAPEYTSIYDSLKSRASDRIPEPTTQAERDARAAAISRQLGADMNWLRGQLIRSGVEYGPAAAGPRAEPPSRDRVLRDGEREKEGQALPGSEPAPGQPGKDGKGAKDSAGAKGGMGDDEPKDGDKSADGEEAKPNIDDLAYILRHGRRLQSLVPEESTAIKDMMELGAVSMSRGEFFRAEERFASVLAVVPGSAAALAGVANAQLGAGLPASGALTLRKLFATHPEMIDTHLGPEILPGRPRLDAILTASRERIAAGNAAGAPGEVQSDRFDFGLVVAYVGFQTDRPEVIREGLDAMRAVRPDDALLGLLQRVWLPDAADPTRPTSPSVR
jgi:hypothetical protein